MKQGWGRNGLRPKGQRWYSGAWWQAAFILLVGLAVGVISMAVTANMYKNSLRTRIHTVAESLDASRVTSLRLANTDAEAQSDYQYLKDKMSRIKEANSDSRFVYLMARDAAGQVYFLADSEPVGSADYSPRGQAYPEASKELKAMFDNAGLLVEGPGRDSYGNWITAFAPIIDTNYRMAAVVGVDVPATHYGFLLGVAGGIPLLLAVSAAVIAHVRHQIRRRQEEHVQFRAEMLSIASHELRTPLTGLRWSEESLLRQKFGNAAQRRMLDIMYDSTRRLEDSIEDVLQMASVESGKVQRLFKKETDIRKLIEDIIVVQRLAAERQQISFTFSKPWPDELLIDCDSQRIKRVFNNLISNAVKFSRTGTVVTVGYAKTAGGKHVISITDEGIGIPAAEQERVMQGYYRAKNTASHNVTGTGMGLYLARTIVGQHDGRMWLESKEGSGTTVYVELPE